MTSRWFVEFAVVFVMVMVAASIGAEQTGHLVRSPETGWPQFRGPARDGVSVETGLLESWPEEGPKLLWSVSGLGKGYSSPIIVNDTVYITGDVGEDLVIFAFDLDAKLLWKAQNGRAWTGPWPGARASCTYYKGRLFHMNAHGRTVCIDPKDGSEVWAVDTLDRFDGTNIKWALSECLLIDRDLVFVTPGGKKAFMAALDIKDGSTVWASEALAFERTYGLGGRTLDEPVADFDKAGYASPILFELGGRRIIARPSGQHLVCIDADTGEFLWTHGVFAKFEVIGTIPVFWKDRIFFAAPDDFGGRMFRIEASKESVRVEEMWETPLDNCHSAMLVVDGLLYGSGYRRLRGWSCIDSETGEMLYSKDDLVKGSCTFADGGLYALGEDGAMELLKPSGDSFETVGRLKIAEGKRKDVWAHPVVFGGRLYLRDHDKLWCYDVKK